MKPDFDMAVGWSKQRGVYPTGGASLETAIAVHAPLGPLRVDTLYVRLTTQGRRLTLELLVAAGAALGPIAVALDRIGVTASLTFESGGNLGPAQLDLGWKPPSGAWLAIDAGPVRGGGYLGFEPDVGRYYGAFALEVFGVGVTVLGLIETRPSFSFVGLIFSECLRSSSVSKLIPARRAHDLHRDVIAVATFDEGHRDPHASHTDLVGELRETSGGGRLCRELRDALGR